MTAKTKEADIFSEENMTNPDFTYVNFKEVGDKAGGILAQDPNLNEEANYGPQMEYLIKQDDGSHVKVSISTNKTSTLEPIKNARKGDQIGFKFTSEVDSKQFPGKKAKIIKAFWVQTEENKALMATPAVAEDKPEELDF